MNIPKRILPLIVISQFCCTSLWFASNGILSDLIINFDLKTGALGHLTSAVQLGFISGTLLFAILTITDRFSPSKVFFVSAIMGALFNLAVIWEGNVFTSILVLRFLTGFFLAGIYPVGMKIAADYYSKGLGLSLGFLVGALVVGTAFPHLVKSMTGSLPWKAVLLTTSTLASLGGFLIFQFVPDGPNRKASQKLDFSAFLGVFKKPDLRAAAFGYFGHMWELYAFWAFVPVILQTYNNLHPTAGINIPVWSFIIIGVGGLACVLGGYLSLNIGTKRTAFSALLLSCLCCLISPWMFSVEMEFAFLAFLLFWGMVVVADSPLFSTLVANNAALEIKGTALTIVNCIGFSITIFSILLINYLQEISNSNNIYAYLAIGPVLGLIALGTNRRKSASVIQQ